MGKGELRCALIVACTAYHIDKFTWGQIGILQKHGFEVHVAASFDAALSGNSSSNYIEQCRERLINQDVKVFEMPFTRFPLSSNNIKAYRSLKKLFKLYSYNLLHCHTPTGGLVSRLAAVRYRKKGLSVIYTAHGFHFFKGAPLLNWLLYYPVEWFLAKLTDCLIVINEEDEKIASKLPAKTVKKINGIGVPREPYDEAKPIDKTAFGLNKNTFVFLYVGELSKRKNQELLIKSFSEIVDKCPETVFLLVGEGVMRPSYEQLISSLNLTQKVLLLGWRDDIPSLVTMSDVVVSSAKQEGLPVNLIEAMMAGKPIIASDCRGNKELAEQAGIVARSQKGFSEAMVLLYNNSELRTNFGQASKAASHKYEAAVVDEEMEKLYIAL